MKKLLLSAMVFVSMAMVSYAAEPVAKPKDVDPAVQSQLDALCAKIDALTSKVDCIIQDQSKAKSVSSTACANGTCPNGTCTFSGACGLSGCGNGASCQSDDLVYLPSMGAYCHRADLPFFQGSGCASGTCSSGNCSSGSCGNSSYFYSSNGGSCSSGSCNSGGGSCANGSCGTGLFGRRHRR